jgi:8-amino-3,8-dideoxy-alpha-D-manno-octulosonate transaminase
MPGYEIFDEAERREVLQVMETGILMRYGFDAQRKGVNKTLELEKAICNKLGVAHAQLTPSGTTALCTALAVAGIGAGDEVIMPTFTFVASFESILALGAVPVLVEIDDTLTLDPAAVEKAITPHTKAIVPVHMCGAQAHIDELMDICRRHNLILIEDACQAMGATMGGRHLGTIGHMGCFSYDFVKTITMGEGGAVVTNDDEYARKADGYVDHGHDHIGNDRGAETHPFLGVNYRVSELSSAIGLAQIGKLDRILARQREVKKYMKDALKAALPGLGFRRILDEEGDNASFLSITLPTLEQAERAVKAMSSEGIGGVFHYYNNNWHYIRRWFHLKERATLYRLPQEVLDRMPDYATVQFPQSDDIISRNLSIAINLSWSDEEVKSRTEAMIRALKSVF